MAVHSTGITRFPNPCRKALRIVSADESIAQDLHHYSNKYSNNVPVELHAQLKEQHGVSVDVIVFVLERLPGLRT